MGRRTEGRQPGCYIVDQYATRAVRIGRLWGYAYASSAAIEHVFAATAEPALLFGNIHRSVSKEEATRLRALGVPVLMGTSTALAAIRHLVDWQRAREAGQRATPALPPQAALDEALVVISAQTRHARSGASTMVQALPPRRRSVSSLLTM
jgi:hypothetical protein